ncbi:hypothetical protein RIF29_09755 [Crotalaria pallida]|uniref:Uncharacterized protein n=1 Tax=Crotalaria pallida TaxID=3830 RepID=A0AAN9FZQ6_CROPI
MRHAQPSSIPFTIRHGSDECTNNEEKALAEDHVNLHEGSPLPPVYALWRSHRSEEAREWEGVVADRIRLFRPFFPETHTTGDILELD